MDPEPFSERLSRLDSAKVRGGGRSVTLDWRHFDVFTVDSAEVAHEQRAAFEDRLASE